MEVIKSTNIFIQHEDENRKTFESRVNKALKEVAGLEKDKVYMNFSTDNLFCSCSLVVVGKEEKGESKKIGF